MKMFAALVVLAAFSLTATAQCEAPQFQKAAPATFAAPKVIPPSVPVPSAADDIESLKRAVAAEKEFTATGPKLYDMATAQRVAAETGKPVVCWMGKHIFANSKARAVSRELGDTTIQAVMDSDGETTDRDGRPLPEHRVKFSDGNYSPNSKVMFFPVANLNADSGRKILMLARGGR